MFESKVAHLSKTIAQMQQSAVDNNASFLQERETARLEKHRMQVG